MKKLSLTVFMLLMPLAAFADTVMAVPAVDTPVASIAVPPGSPWYAPIIAALFPILLGALTWLSARASSFVATKLEEAKTKEQGTWYSAAFGLASVAVKAAETFYSPDSGKGKEKKVMASKWLTDRLIAMDPNLLKRNPNAAEMISGFVDAAYADVFAAIAPLGPAVATSSSTPSGLVTKSANGAW